MPRALSEPNLPQGEPNLLLESMPNLFPGPFRPPGPPPPFGPGLRQKGLNWLELKFLLFELKLALLKLKFPLFELKFELALFELKLALFEPKLFGPFPRKVLGVKLVGVPVKAGG